MCRWRLMDHGLSFHDWGCINQSHHMESNITSLRKTSINMACNCSPHTPQIYVLFYSLAKNLGCVVIGRNKINFKTFTRLTWGLLWQSIHEGTILLISFWHTMTKFNKSQSMTMKKVFKWFKFNIRLVPLKTYMTYTTC